MREPDLIIYMDIDEQEAIKRKGLVSEEQVSALTAYPASNK